MDFGSLLHAAQANEHRAKQEPTKCYRSKFSPPKKEGKNRTLSVNIQKFLQRKEEEEKQKELDAKKKRDELLALRSQDGKAKKRVSAMLKRTKAANKSAIEDAVDDDNTAVTINGPSQPDEDDYGYVSQEASAYYNKLMDKYNSAPTEEPLFSQSRKTVHRDLNSTKDRVRMALLKEEEEEMMPHKRKRKSKTKQEDDPGDTTLNYSSSDLRDFSSHAVDHIDQETERVPPPKPKPKKLAPPPIDFRDLLKLAEKKQFEPIKIEPKKKTEEDEERPMTKKQKLEYMKELEWRRRKEEARAGRELSAQSKSLQNSQKTKIRDDQAHIKENGMMEKSQERQVKTLQQMRIPKINSAKRDEPVINSKREEARGVKHEEQFSQKLPRTNGNYSQNSSYSNSSKLSIPVKDKLVEKTPTVIENVSKSRTDAVYNSVLKYSRDSSNVDSHKILKNIPTQSSGKHVVSKTIDMKSVGESNMNLKKIALQSGYDKKLQEAIMFKLEETKRNSEIQKKIPNSQGTSSKTINKSFDTKNKPLNSREYEKNTSALKSPTKFLNTGQHSESVLKQVSVKHSQEISNNILLSKSKTVPSSKSREFPSDLKTKTVPCTSKQYSSSDKAKQTSQPNNRDKISSSDIKFKNVPQDRQLPMSSNKLKNPPNPGCEKVLSAEVKSRQLPPSDVKYRQAPPSDVKYRQAPPSDVKYRQAPPSDVKYRQAPPSDVKHRQAPPSDVKHRQAPPSDVKYRQAPPSDVKYRQTPPSDFKSRQATPSDVKSRQAPPSDVKPRQFPPAGVKNRQLPLSDVKSRQFPPSDVRPRQFPPPDVKSKQFPPADVKRKQKPIVKRRITDSDDEYDSEMDDFIDDGPLDEEDVSKHIREIFGYDKRKYSRIDDDEDECMESNYASILKEEFISTKTGILEDLEDIKREKEMERRKKAMKKRKL